MKQITSLELLNEIISKSHKPVLVDFWAPWCAPCRMLMPILEELEKTYGDDIEIVKVNVDEAPEVASFYGILGLPTVLIFVNGQLKDKQTGLQPLSVYRTMIERALEKNT